MKNEKKYKVLLPIKEEYVKKIISEEKRIEFRKSLFKKPVDKIVIYESGTKKHRKIVGNFEIEEVVSDTPEALYEKYKDIAGISKEKYMEYFKGKDIAYGYLIKNFKRCFIKTDVKFKDFKVPQNFIYIEDEMLISPCIFNLSLENEYLIFDCIKKSEKDFPNIVEWFEKALKNKNIFIELFYYGDIENSLMELTGYTIFDKEKNKICRIEKISDNLESTKILINECIERLDRNKPIRISVPSHHKNLCKKLENIGFKLKKTVNNKYKEGDTIYEYELFRCN